MTGLIALADTAEIADPGVVENTGEIVEQVTGFTLRIGDGPVVTAASVGDLWTFAFHGKSNDDNLRLAVDHHEAVMVATLLARRLAELEPDRRTYEAQRKALTVWLKSLVGREGEQS